MKTIDENIETTIDAMLYIIKQLGGCADFHKVFKILYFADQLHLAKYGVSITNDTYIAMNNGPVPSNAYDILKALRGDGLLISQKEKFVPYFKVASRYTIEAIENPDMDNLSISELSALDTSIKENKGLSFSALSEKSHDKAWEKAFRHGEINIIDMAKAAGATNDLVKYIQTQIENQYAEFE